MAMAPGPSQRRAGRPSCAGRPALLPEVTRWPGSEVLCRWHGRSQCVSVSQHEEAAVATQTPGQADPAASADDPLPEAIALARGAADAGLGLKLLGGLAVRVLCPDFPP